MHNLYHNLGYRGVKIITLKSCPVCESQNIAEYRVMPGGDFIVDFFGGFKGKL